jgi:hypothetical protein
MRSVTIQKYDRIEWNPTWRSYVWHYFSALFCPWKASVWRMHQHTTGGPVPRCDTCFASWGSCAHTGGPLSL